MQYEMITYVCIDDQNQKTNNETQSNMNVEKTPPTHSIFFDSPARFFGVAYVTMSCFGFICFADANIHNHVRFHD